VLFRNHWIYKLVISLYLIQFISGYGDQQIANLVDYFAEALTQAGVDVGAIENEWSKIKDLI
jgi:hypothetical protein